MQKFIPLKVLEPCIKYLHDTKTISLANTPYEIRKIREENKISNNFTDKTYEFLYKKIQENNNTYKKSIRRHRVVIIILCTIHFINIMQNLFF